MMEIIKKATDLLKIILLVGMVLCPVVGNTAEIDISVKEPETTYHALPKNMGRKKAAALALDQHETLGLAVSEAFYTLAIYENQIKIEIGHTKHQIFLQNSLKRNVCMYEEAKAHEEKHIHISKAAMHGFKVKLEKEINEMAAAGKKDKEIAAHIKESFSNFEKKVKEAQLEFDRQDYKRIAKACQ